jgi:uncharacterized protein (UPF0333 family)
MMIEEQEEVHVQHKNTKNNKQKRRFKALLLYLEERCVGGIFENFGLPDFSAWHVFYMGTLIYKKMNNFRVCLIIILFITSSFSDRFFTGTYVPFKSDSNCCSIIRIEGSDPLYDPVNITITWGSFKTCSSNQTKAIQTLMRVGGASGNEYLDLQSMTTYEFYITDLFSIMRNDFYAFFSYSNCTYSFFCPQEQKFITGWNSNWTLFIPPDNSTCKNISKIETLSAKANHLIVKMTYLSKGCQSTSTCEQNENIHLSFMSREYAYGQSQISSQPIGFGIYSDLLTVTVDSECITILKDETSSKINEIISDSNFIQKIDPQGIIMIFVCIFIIF